MKRVTRGMTLIEVLVALAVLSLLSVGMISAFRVAHQTYQRIGRLDRSYWDVVATQRFLRKTLESAYPFEPDAGHARYTALDGTSDRLDVTAPSSLAEHSIGYRRFSFVLVPRGDGYQDLVVTSGLDRNGWPGSSDAAPSTREVLVPRVKEVRWSYLEGAAGAGWQSGWKGQRLPKLVRLSIEFPVGDSRRWPDLIVAPRVTDDANCSFDVVAQACRESGA